jgi:hypothetical protein
MRFTLFPHPQTSCFPSVRVTGSLTRSTSDLHVRYALRGHLSEILLPEQASAPARRDCLWQSTCFEYFVAPTDLPCYWEVNLSPSGDWNVYAFDSYRAGMREEAAIAELPCCISRASDFCLLELDLPLSEIIHPEQPLVLGVSAVIQHRSGQRSFHALMHCGAAPDFHQRESFMLGLPPAAGDSDGGPAANFSACA